MDALLTAEELSWLSKLGGCRTNLVLSRSTSHHVADQGAEASTGVAAEQPVGLDPRSETWAEREPID